MTSAIDLIDVSNASDFIGYLRLTNPAWGSEHATKWVFRGQADATWQLLPRSWRGYPIDWRELSAMIRFERAGGRCETCRRPHGREVRHLGDGRWWDEDGKTWRNGRGRPLLHIAGLDDITAVSVTKVVLATAHLDHDPTNNRPRNLKALCQRCHILHDRPEHRRRRWLTLRMRKAMGDLFLGTYDC